jgi:hypothetical protein
VRNFAVSAPMAFYSRLAAMSIARLIALPGELATSP